MALTYVAEALQSRIAAFGLALSMTLTVLISVAGLAHVEPAQNLANATIAPRV